jgi:hypothetical protein
MVVAGHASTHIKDLRSVPTDDCRERLFIAIGDELFEKHHIGCGFLCGPHSHLSREFGQNRALHYAIALSEKCSRSNNPRNVPRASTNSDSR